MRRRFLPVLAVAAAGIAFGASPALAATQGCHTAPPPPSAVNVYVEQVPTSGFCPQKSHPQHSTVQPNQGKPNNVRQSGPSAPTGTKKGQSKPPAVQPPRVITTSPLSSPAPSAVSAAFDLGFGPTALFAALLAAAALLAVGGGLRHGRR